MYLLQLLPLSRWGPPGKESAGRPDDLEHDSVNYFDLYDSVTGSSEEWGRIRGWGWSYMDMVWYVYVYKYTSVTKYARGWSATGNESHGCTHMYIHTSERKPEDAPPPPLSPCSSMSCFCLVLVIVCACEGGADR